jgi:hypothetical protein
MLGQEKVFLDFLDKMLFLMKDEDKGVQKAALSNFQEIL